MLAVAAGTSPTPLVHTYSIVARDPETGEMGVAVQSHYFSVGPVVAWAEAGVGAVATQSLVLVDYGPKGLDLMRGGMTATQALATLVQADSARDVRQVAMVDSKGNVAAHTGPGCIPAAGQQIGKQYSVQANLMDKETVWPAMSQAFEKATGDLAERMLQALEAAQKAAETSAAGSPRRSSSSKHNPPGNRGPTGSWTCGSKIIPSRCRSCGDSCACGAPTTWKMRVTTPSRRNSRRKRYGDALALFDKVFARERRWAALVPRLAKVGLFPSDAAKIEQVTARAKKDAPW